MLLLVLLIAVFVGSLAWCALTPTQRRRCMLRSSESSSTCAFARMRGSNAMPQIGQNPGWSRIISGCMGQVY